MNHLTCPRCHMLYIGPGDHKCTTGPLLNADGVSLTNHTVSFKAEVIADDSGNWASNTLRFATREEALGYARDLGLRWTLVRRARAVATNDPVNYAWSRERGLRKLFTREAAP